MTITITHAKVNQVADWTQSKLDEYINAGLYPAGTRISDITQPSDWNDDHTSAELDALESMVTGAVIIDMQSADKTLTDAEAAAATKIILNSGDGTKTLYLPVTATIGVLQSFITAFTTNGFYFNNLNGGAETYISTNTDIDLSLGTTYSIGSQFLSYTGALSNVDLGAKTLTNTAKIEAQYFETLLSSNRGAVCSEHFVCLDADYTLTSTTNSQKMFDSTANGALTLPVGTYFFECQFKVSSMSATSGNAGWSVLGAGTATIGRVSWAANGRDVTDTTVASSASSGVYIEATGTAGNILAATAGTAMYATITGVFSVTATGTIIPSIALTTAAAAVVETGSFFKCHKVGSATVTTVGNWS